MFALLQLVTAPNEESKFEKGGVGLFTSCEDSPKTTVDSASVWQTPSYLAYGSACSMIESNWLRVTNSDLLSISMSYGEVP